MNSNHSPKSRQRAAGGWVGGCLLGTLPVWLEWAEYKGRGKRNKV